MSRGSTTRRSPVSSRREIDHVAVRELILSAVGEHESLREARQAGVYVIPVRDEAITMCAPLAARTVDHLIRMPDMTRIEKRDLEQAAILGIIEGVDTYQPRRLYRTPADRKAGRPGRPIQVNTHLFFRIRKRVYEEVATAHWSIMRPNRAEMERYMKNAMTEGERRAYINTYMQAISETYEEDDGNPARFEKGGRS